MSEGGEYPEILAREEIFRPIGAGYSLGFYFQRRDLGWVERDLKRYSDGLRYGMNQRLSTMNAGSPK